MGTPTITTETKKIYKSEKTVLEIQHNGDITMRTNDVYPAYLGTLSGLGDNEDALRLLLFTIEHILKIHKFNEE